MVARPLKLSCCFGISEKVRLGDSAQVKLSLTPLQPHPPDELQVDYTEIVVEICTGIPFLQNELYIHLISLTTLVELRSVLIIFAFFFVVTQYVLYCMITA